MLEGSQRYSYCRVIDAGQPTDLSRDDGRDQGIGIDDDGVDTLDSNHWGGEASVLPGP